MASVVPDVCSTVQAMKKGYVIAYISTKEAIGYKILWSAVPTDLQSVQELIHKHVYTHFLSIGVLGGG